MMSIPADRRGRAAAVVACIWLLALPLAVLAHAEIESAVPEDGALLDAPPTEIVITYTEELDAAKSSLTLHDASGAQIATGGVDPDNDAAMRIDPPDLAPGTYEVRSTAAAAHDSFIERKTLTFTVLEPTPAPPTPPPTAAPSATPAPTPAPTASPSPSPSPSAAPGPTGTSGGDVLLPIVAAVAVVAILGAMLLRGRSRGGGGA